MVATEQGQAPSKRRRRWLQYSLRTLLVLTAVCALFFSWVATKLREARRQAAAAAALTERGAGVGYSREHVLPSWLRRMVHDETCSVESVDFASSVWRSHEQEMLIYGLERQCDYLESLLSKRNSADDERGWRAERIESDLSELGLAVTQHAKAVDVRQYRRLIRTAKAGLEDSYITDADLVHLREFTKVSTLKLGQTRITDAGLAHLEELTELESLVLSHTGVGDQGLAHLQQLRNLQSLDLSRTGVGDQGLAHLQQLRNLQSLDLSGTSVGDGGLAHLSQLTELSILHLHDTAVGDSGFASLPPLTKLTFLDLSNTRITDATLARLKGSTQLQYLHLHNTRVSDAGLAFLRGMPQLRVLDLSDTNVAGKGLKHLRRIPALLHLDVAGTQVTDSALEYLEGATNIQTLYLGCTHVTDAGLPHLKGMTGLEGLSLNVTEVTGAGLVHLRGLSGLTGLWLSEPYVTEQDLDDLRQALPRCEISLRPWDAPPVEMEYLLVDAKVEIAASSHTADGSWCFRLRTVPPDGHQNADLFLLWKPGPPDLHFTNVYVVECLEAPVPHKFNRIARGRSDAACIASGRVERTLESCGALDLPRQEARARLEKQYGRRRLSELLALKEMWTELQGTPEEGVSPLPRPEGTGVFDTGRFEDPFAPARPDSPDVDRETSVP